MTYTEPPHQHDRFRMDVSYWERLFRINEDELLGMFRIKKEENPSEKHETEWAEFAEFVAKRRSRK